MRHLARGRGRIPSLAFAICDRYPVSSGHTIVVTRRLVPTWFDATSDEQLALLRLVEEVRRALEATHHPDGWNIGVNLRVDRDLDPAAYAEVVAAFGGWWRRAAPLTADWVERYAARARQAPPAPRPGEVEPEEPPAVPPEPNVLQREALNALAETRHAGRRRGLVVMATGLGKTWLAAFDVAATAKEATPRVLFVAHRFELLEEAAGTFRRMFPDARIGWFSGDHDDAARDIVFASVQKLSRPEQLGRFIAAWVASTT